MKLTTEKISSLGMQENLRDMNGTGESVISTPYYKEYVVVEILHDNTDERQQPYLHRVFRSFSEIEDEVFSYKVHRGIGTNLTSRAITISNLPESLCDTTSKPRFSNVGSIFSKSGQISGPIYPLESGHIPDYPGQIHQTLKPVNSSDLDETVPSGVSDGSRVQLMILSLMSEELCVRWNLCLFLSVLLIVFSSRRHYTYHLLHSLYMVWSSVQSSFTKVCTVANDSPLCLLLRARVAIGIKLIERMPYCQLIQLA